MIINGITATVSAQHRVTIALRDVDPVGKEGDAGGTGTGADVPCGGCQGLHWAGAPGKYIL